MKCTPTRSLALKPDQITSNGRRRLKQLLNAFAQLGPSSYHARIMSAPEPCRLIGQPNFWVQPKGLGRGWRARWNHVVSHVHDSDALTLHKAMEAGVPTEVVELLSRALGDPLPQVLIALGVPGATYRRRVQAGKPLPELAGHRAVAILRLMGAFRQLLDESGDPGQVREFNLEGWVSSWIKEPMAVFGGETPMALLRSPEGQRYVETVIKRMRDGPVA